jgi:hypothetical protein
MLYSPRRVVVLTLVMGSAIVRIGLGPMQEARSSPQASRAESTARKTKERVSGVIVKVEPYRKTEEPAPKAGERTRKETREVPHRVRVTVNTAVVWRDWVRDKAVNPAHPNASPPARGENSVGTKGEPIAPETLVVVDVGPETRLSARFRSSTDEADRGSETVAGAEQKEKDPADSARPDSKTDQRREAAKPPEIKLTDLKKGLFVDVECRKASDLNAASSVVVLKPIGGPETSATQSEPKK